MHMVALVDSSNNIYEVEVSNLQSRVLLLLKTGMYKQPHHKWL
jgi:hypothetical protein